MISIEVNFDIRENVYLIEEGKLIIGKVQEISIHKGHGNKLSIRYTINIMKRDGNSYNKEYFQDSLSGSKEDLVNKITNIINGEE